MKLAGVGFDCDSDRVHVCPRRAAVTPGDEPLHSALFPFYHALNITIVAVPNPA
jgi:hypothetical protein